jgi:hypothetical protein
MDAEEYERRLLERERVIMRDLSENDGYVSPWYIGPMGDADGSGGEGYWAWRHHRKNFVTSGDASWLDSMGKFVDMDNPPLASDCKSDDDLRTWGVQDYLSVLAVFAALFVLIMVMEFS